MDYLEQMLAELKREDNYRILREAQKDGKYVIYEGKRYLNMSSNDYLGLSGEEGGKMQEKFFEWLAGQARFVMSNPASRLMTGNSADYELLESSIASLYGDRSCLVLGSGYAVNTGLLPALTSRGDIIVADKLVHASIVDGLRLCECEWHRYAHNDMDRLESIVKKARDNGARNVWIVTESVFSMDGHRAPIKEIVELKQRYGCKIYLDEAHAFGVYGQNGMGLAAEYGLDSQIDIMVATLGKAMVSVGGFAIMDNCVRELMINRMRPLIFSTALAPVNILWSKYMVESLPAFGPQREHLKSLILRLVPAVAEATQIIPIMAYENAAAGTLAEKLREDGFWVTPIRYPTVPKGQARIRVSLTAAMQAEDIDRFIVACRGIG